MHNEDNLGDNSGSEYKVGYKKPPREYQFKKGPGGNPGGKKPKAKTFEESMKQQLSEKITIQEGGKSKKISIMDALIKRVLNEALGGNYKYIALIFKYFQNVYITDQALAVKNVITEDAEKAKKMKNYILEKLAELDEKETQAEAKNKDEPNNLAQE